MLAPVRVQAPQAPLVGLQALTRNTLRDEVLDLLKAVHDSNGICLFGCPVTHGNPRTAQTLTERGALPTQVRRAGL